MKTIEQKTCDTCFCINKEYKCLLFDKEVRPLQKACTDYTDHMLDILNDVFGDDDLWNL